MAGSVPICSVVMCEKVGWLTVRGLLGLERFDGLDQEILFCARHAVDLSDIYSIYKGLEDMASFQVVLQGFSLPTWGLQWLDSQTIKDQIEQKEDLLQVFQQSLQLRQRFQSALKADIKSNGHEHFMARMNETITDLHKFIQAATEELHSRRNFVSDWKTVKNKLSRLYLPWKKLRPFYLVCILFFFLSLFLSS